MSQAKVALSLGCVLMAFLGAITLTHSPSRLLRRGVRPEASLGSTSSSATVCQVGETIPANTSALRIGMEASFGPPVLVRAYSGSRVLIDGRRSANWTDSTVTIPVAPLKRAVSNAKLCVIMPVNDEHVALWGAAAPAGQTAVGGNGEALPGRISVEYLESSHRSWWSQALSVARHLGLGHSISGSWVALLLAALTGATSALILGLAWRVLP